MGRKKHRWSKFWKLANPVNTIKSGISDVKKAGRKVGAWFNRSRKTIHNISSKIASGSDFAGRALKDAHRYIQKDTPAYKAMSYAEAGTGVVHGFSKETAKATESNKSARKRIAARSEELLKRSRRGRSFMEKAGAYKASYDKTRSALQGAYNLGRRYNQAYTASQKAMPGNGTLPTRSTFVTAKGVVGGRHVIDHSSSTTPSYH